MKCEWCGLEKSTLVMIMRAKTERKPISSLCTCDEPCKANWCYAGTTVRTSQIK